MFRDMKIGLRLGTGFAVLFAMFVSPVFFNAIIFPPSLEAA